MLIRPISAIPAGHALSGHWLQHRNNDGCEMAVGFAEVGIPMSETPGDYQ